MSRKISIITTTNNHDAKTQKTRSFEYPKHLTASVPLSEIQNPLHGTRRLSVHPGATRKLPSAQKHFHIEDIERLRKRKFISKIFNFFKTSTKKLKRELDLAVSSDSPEKFKIALQNLVDRNITVRYADILIKAIEENAVNIAAVVIEYLWKFKKYNGMFFTNLLFDYAVDGHQRGFDNPVDVGIVKLLVEKGHANVDERTDYTSVLGLAAQTGNLPVIRYLVESRDATIMDAYKVTDYQPVLYQAYLYKQESTLRYLINQLRKDYSPNAIKTYLIGLRMTDAINYM